MQCHCFSKLFIPTIYQNLAPRAYLDFYSFEIESKIAIKVYFIEEPNSLSLY